MKIEPTMRSDPANLRLAGWCAMSAPIINDAAPKQVIVEVHVRSTFSGLRDVLDKLEADMVSNPGQIYKLTWESCP